MSKKRLKKLILIIATILLLLFLSVYLNYQNRSAADADKNVLLLTQYTVRLNQLNQEYKSSYQKDTLDRMSGIAKQRNELQAILIQPNPQSLLDNSIAANRDTFPKEIATMLEESLTNL